MDTVDDTAVILEDSFCRNFTCCGQHLSDMHALLKHQSSNTHITTISSNSFQNIPSSPSIVIIDNLTKNQFSTASSSSTSNVSTKSAISPPPSSSLSQSTFLGRRTPSPPNHSSLDDFESYSSSECSMPQTPNHQSSILSNLITASCNNCPSSFEHSTNCNNNRMSRNQTQTTCIPPEYLHYNMSIAAPSLAKISSRYNSAPGILNSVLDRTVNNIDKRNQAAAKLQRPAKMTQTFSFGSIASSMDLDNFENDLDKFSNKFVHGNVEDDFELDCFNEDYSRMSDLEFTMEEDSMSNRSFCSSPVRSSNFGINRMTSSLSSLPVPSTSNQAYKNSNLSAKSAGNLSEQIISANLTHLDAANVCDKENDSSGIDGKPYKCTVPGCNKKYKQPNGLKYHRLRGTCSFAIE